SSWTSPATLICTSRAASQDSSPFTCRLAPNRAVPRSVVAVSGRIASVLIAFPSQDAGAGFGGLVARGLVPGGLEILGCGPSGFLFPHMAPLLDKTTGQRYTGAD